MSHVNSSAPSIGIGPPLTGGMLIHCGPAPREALVVLTSPDPEGYLRAAPVVAAAPPGASPGAALEPADFIEGGVSGWLRLDRVSWRRIESAQPAGMLKPTALARLYRALCKQEARDYADVAFRPTPFVPGKTIIPPSGKVIGSRELELLVESSLDGWLTTGRFNDAFERSLGRFLGRRHVRTTNSGSSANLLAMSALTSPLLGERALRPGDEVITVAAGFPTTVNPSPAERTWSPCSSTCRCPPTTSIPG